MFSRNSFLERSGEISSSGGETIEPSALEAKESLGKNN